MATKKYERSERGRDKALARQEKKKERFSRQTIGILYIVKDAGFVKFGFSNSWRRRVMGAYLSPAMKLLYVRLGEQEEEHAFRTPWAAYRVGVRSEWYRYEGELKKYIQRLRAERRHRVSVESYKRSIKADIATLPMVADQPIRSLLEVY
ncbi:MAG: hypothetical protein JSS82_15645 [Bacteroidetes bacterium]|nr:hypothetical protein [Bacteroidota bacterium]